jgi:serine phosphatase RsbU (regulator of sigma subunit)
MKRPWQRWKRTGAFFRALSWRSTFVLCMAVFFTFGSMGFILDMLSAPKLDPWPVVAATVIYFGLVGALYFIGLTRARLLMAVAIPIQVSFPKLYPLLRKWAGDHPPAPLGMEAMGRHLQIDGIGCIVFIMLGYAIFIRFIGGTGMKQLRMRTEIALAERIHATLVPPVSTATERFEVLGRSEPSSEVGGDLLDVVEQDGRLLACVADVSGHGVSAGTFMGMVKSALRMKLLSSDAVGALLDDLDRVVGQIRSPEMFVTIAALRFDGAHAAELGLAGHLPILHYRYTSDSIEAIENAHPPLGVVDGQRHGSRRVEFGSGDLFVLLTDGLTEVLNVRGDQFGTHGVESVLRQHAREPLATIYATLLSAVRAHGPQTDDQTLLLVRIR